MSADCRYCRTTPNGGETACKSLAGAHDCPWMSRSDWEAFEGRQAASQGGAGGEAVAWIVKWATKHTPENASAYLNEKDANRAAANVKMYADASNIVVIPTFASAAQASLGPCTQAELDAWEKYLDKKDAQLLLMWVDRALKAETAAQEAWECGARKQGTPGGNAPADCDWPGCGCDPYANKVLEAIDEAGFEITKKRVPIRWDANENRSYEPVETLAIEIYDGFVYDGPGATKPKWTPGGNGLKQDEARFEARRRLREAGHSPSVPSAEGK